MHLNHWQTSFYINLTFCTEIYTGRKKKKPKHYGCIDTNKKKFTTVIAVVRKPIL